MLTLADELVLLAINENGDVASSASLSLDHGIAAAHLLELALAGRVRLNEGDVVVVDRTPTGDQPVDEVLSAVGRATPPRGTQQWLGELAAGVRGPVLAGLHERGILDERTGRVLGLIPRTRHVEADPVPEREVRARLHAALAAAGEVDARTAALGSLVKATELWSEVFPDKDERALARSRLGELSTGQALRDALGAANESLVTTLGMVVATPMAASVASTGAAVVIVGM